MELILIVASGCIAIGAGDGVAMGLRMALPLGLRMAFPCESMYTVLQLMTRLPCCFSNYSNYITVLQYIARNGTHCLTVSDFAALYVSLCWFCNVANVAFPCGK